MTEPAKISLAQQLEAVQLAAVRQNALATSGQVKALRPKSVEQYDVERLQAAVRTLVWLQDNMAAVREFAALKPPVREAALAMGREIARKQAIAEAGGPVR